MDDRIIEKLASLEHDQWQEWAESVGGDIKVLLDIINENVSLDDLDSSQLAVVEKNMDRVENWSKLMIDYNGLSEEMKEKDRVYARIIYEVFENESD